MAKAAAARKADPVAEQLAAMQSQINTVLEQNKALAAENAQLRTVAPVSRSSHIDTGGMDLPRGGDVHIPSTGQARMEVSEIAVPDGPPSMAKIDELKFMDEMVEVQISPSSDKNDKQLVSVWNDGRHQLFVRGKFVACRRKFLEVLARSKPDTYDSVEFIDEAGVRQIKYPRNTAHKYPLQVKDPNPRGADWLRKIMAEP